MLRSLAATIVAVVLAPGAPASAEDQSIQVDPNSPAGTEYGLPVDQAKQSGAMAAPSGSAATSGSSAGQLFGEGIAPPSAKAARGVRRTDQAPATNRSAGAAGGHRRGDAGAATVRASGSALPWLLGSGALVVVVGLALGFGLRRLSTAS